ncbi:heme ABC exporter ATP-binding protein CcmA [candidate division KSB1 bacterium]|nr:heme ABC exporter ATP-binding protein CcmA [candidate division KSB1 bacterium]
MIRTEGLTKNFGFKKALSQVSFKIKEGEYAALLGVNGAGKTTLVRILSTLSRASCGGVWMNGLDVKKNSIKIRKIIGVMSHSSFLYPQLSAEENLIFYADMYRIPDKRHYIAQLLKRVGLWERRYDLVSIFSRGMQQRLSLARAILHQPKILLLDEPFTGLDVHAAGLLTDLINENVKNGITVLLATHDLEYAKNHANRILLLKNGILSQDTAASAISLEQITNKLTN